MAMALVRSALPTARSGPPSEAAKAVEALFETQTVVEIREVETKTRTDIEEKNKQLRLLVGNSYRDLISSADTILQMASCCNKVLSNVVEIQGGFSQLASSVSVGKGSKEEHKQEGDRRKAMHAIGGRIKYLVDTPEMIWGALDTRAYLEAARRFLRASAVHRLLTQHAGAELRSRFPLVHRQWPQIQKFQREILERVTQRLRSEAPLSAGDTATALAAAASLQQLTSEQVLALYLDARRVWLTALLTAAANESATLSVDNLAEVFTEAAQELQEGVWQVGRLFLNGHSSDKGKALLPATAADDSLGGGELLFGPLSTTSGVVEESEADAWQAQTATTLAQLQPLKQPEAAAASEGWLTGAAEDFARLGGGLLQACQTVSELTVVEAKLRESVTAWRHISELDAGEDTLLSPRHSFPATPKASGPLKEQLPANWEGVCEWVLGKRISLWDTVFEAAFLQRGKELIEAAFVATRTALEGPLQQCTETARNTPPSVPGSYRAVSWPEDAPPAEQAQRKRARFDEGGRPSLAANASATGMHTDWRPLVANVQMEFDARLQAALKDSLLLLAEQAPAKESGVRRGTYSRNYPLPPRKSIGRAAVLEPFIQEQCAQAAAEVPRQLGGQLEALPPTSIDSQNSFAAVEEALMIGRLATALGSSETLLSVILGPPEEWREAQFSRSSGFFAASGDLRRAGRGEPPTPDSRFAAIQQQFREVALEAHTRWAKWAASGLGRELESSMVNDAALVSSTALRTWEETVITQEDDLGEGPMETRFQLPAIPSSGAMMYLLAAGRELQRAGGAKAGAIALDLLDGELAAAALEAFGRALAAGPPLVQRLTEKGVLQLLFDARFLRDALCGKGVTTGKAGSKTTEFAHAFADLENSLQERLDPIDWAIYGSYLWANEAALFQRVRILYGSLIHHKRTPAEAPPVKSASSGEANIMSMAPAAARFAYLPISTPSISASGLRQLPSTGIPHGGLEEHGPSNDYSFASLGGLRPGANLEREAESAATTAFEALQSRFTTQRLGAIGSLLGDRAAEVTAMAQQSFSDIGLPSAFTTALGGSSAGATATGLLASFRGFRSGAE